LASLVAAAVAGSSAGWQRGVGHPWLGIRIEGGARSGRGCGVGVAGIQRAKAERSSVLCRAGKPAGGWWGSGLGRLRRFRQKGVGGPTCALSREASLRSVCGSRADR